MTTKSKIALAVGITTVISVGGFFGYKWWSKQRLPRVTVKGIDYVSKTIDFTVDGKPEQMQFNMGMKKNGFDISPYKAASDTKVTGLEVKDKLGITRNIITV